MQFVRRSLFEVGCIQADMPLREVEMGRVVRFLLPSLKLRQPGQRGRAVEDDVHAFLMRTFAGYTAASGNLFGYWTDEAGHNSYGEHREFTIASNDQPKLLELKHFLSGLSAQLDERCLYLEIGDQASLIYAERSEATVSPGNAG